MPEDSAYYRHQLGWLAFFTLPRRLLDTINLKDERIEKLEAELEARTAHYNTEIETLRREFIDREVARLGFKPIHQPEAPPQPAPQQRSQASLIDRARAELLGQTPARTAADRAESLQDSLKKIQENGAAAAADLPLE